MATAAVEIRDAIDRCRTTQKTTPSGGYNKGEVIVNAGLVQVCAKTTIAGELVGLIYACPKVLVNCAVAPTAGYPVGTKLYWDVADNVVNTGVTGNSYFGRVIIAAVAGATAVLVDMRGDNDN